MGSNCFNQEQILGGCKLQSTPLNLALQPPGSISANKISRLEVLELGDRQAAG